MKKVLKTGLLAALCLLTVLSFAACSKFGGVKKAFEKAGYTYSEEANDTVNKIKEELKDADGNTIPVTPHLFTKSLSVVIVFEFKSSKELEKAVEESATLKGFVKDVQKSDYVNGNCVLFTLDLLNLSSIVEIFKNA